MDISNIFIDPNVRTYSRDGQDRYVMDNVFRGKMRGYFLDIGASDGMTENNTILMEKFYEWDGICCECDPRSVINLRHNRECNIMASPIFRTTGEIIEYELHIINHLSGISGYQLEKFHKTTNHVLRMVTISLMDCLKQFRAPSEIEYLSLDTEGTEYEILATFDFSKYKIKYISVEHNFQEPKRTQIRKLLETNGYVYHRSIVSDDDYIYTK